jgi:hypothetical protein
LPRESGLFVGLDRATDARDTEIDRVDEPILGNAGTVTRHLALPPVDPAAMRPWP